MAEDGLISEERVIGRIQKSKSAWVQVSIVTWQGSDYVDLREVLPQEGGTFQLTRKGIRFKVDRLTAIQELLAGVNVGPSPEHPDASS